ncbi:MAG: GntR family transcriptional regulator [Actinomycetota bacterium]|jgi:GntR family transcriptional regulator, rspAB operon transcriptional repressor|nr:GntR family transcriptional regulator [Actinomycetota bacterium]
MAPDLSPGAASSLRDEAYRELRQMIVRLDFAPGDVLREDELREVLGIGRTPIREALQRLEREHFVTVIPRRGMFVSGIDVSELSMLFETRAVMEPYAARLAALRGVEGHWDAMYIALAGMVDAHGDPAAHLTIDRRCHEIMWEAAANRFLLDTLDMLYAQSDRLWHLYLAEVADMEDAVVEHGEILSALRCGDADRAASLVESHVQSFDAQIRSAVAARLEAPLSGGGA